MCRLYSGRSYSIVQSINASSVSDTALLTRRDKMQKYNHISNARLVNHFEGGRHSSETSLCNGGRDRDNNFR